MMTDSQIETISNQINMLNQFFSEHIDSDYVYLDFPGHMNVGDHLIALGAWELLKSCPYQCLKKTTYSGFDWVIPPGTIILLHGGGNFGDLYPGANWFRNEIVKRFPEHKIIFLPQTITYINNSLIGEDALVCARHNDLHICARDYKSYQILKDYFSSNHLYLLPDTAWGLYDKLTKKTSFGTEKSLFIDRKDKEKNGQWGINADETMDWSDILKRIKASPRLKFYSIIRKLGKKLNSVFLRRISDKVLLYIVQPYLLKNTNRFFLEFDKVYTTRLHGLIFATMLHIPVEWKDTKYGKISYYVQSWL